jgi:arylsulfatase A-like enzyme
MIIVPPGGLDRGRVDGKSLVSGVDIAPTVYDYAGIDSAPEVHGRSLRSAVDRNQPAESEYVVMHIAPGSKRDPEMRKIEGRMVRSNRYKYVLFDWGQPREQLFDLHKDPGELKNLATDEAGADIISAHREMLADWKKRTGDPFKISD